MSKAYHIGFVNKTLPGQDGNRILKRHISMTSQDAKFQGLLTIGF